MEWVNFREIRARISLERVLREYYQVTNLKVSGKTATGPCPVHGGDNPRAFHVDFEKNLWHCFTGCKKGGNQLDLVAAKDGVPVREAALRLKRHFLGDDDGEAPQTPPPTPRSPAHPTPAVTPARVGAEKGKPVNRPLSLSLQLLPDHPHILEDRRLQQSTAEHFGIGYCARGILAGCIGIPIHDEAGQLVAYAGRRLRFSEAADLGKYRFPKGFHKDQVLYNLHRALAAITDAPLIVVEGFFSVLKLYESGLTAVAVMGSDLSEHQAALAAKANQVVLLFDGNEAGRKGAEVALGRLTDIGVPVTLVDLPDGWEPEDCTPDQLTWLLRAADLGLRRVAFDAHKDEAATVH